MQLDFDGEVFILTCRFNDNYMIENLDKRWSKPRKHWRVYDSRINRTMLKGLKFKYISPPAEERLNAETVIENDVQNVVTWTTPRPFQVPAVQKMLSLKYCALFAPIGSGKSKIAIDVIQSIYYAEKIDKILIIGIVSIIENWKAELKKHWVHNDPPMDIIRITGIESYSTGKIYHEMLDWVDDKTLILVDESSKIKNSSALRTEKVTDIGLKCAYRYIMTGSSILNGEIDLYAQFNFLHTDIVGISTLVGFRKRYCIYGGYKDKKIIGYKRQEELINALTPYSFVITKKEAMPHLPEQTFSPREVDPTSEQKRLIKKIQEELKTEVIGSNGQPIEKRIKNILTKFMRVSQIAGGFLEDGSPVKGGSPKIAAIKDILEDAPDEQLVVFTRFVPELLALEKEIKDSKVIYGDVERTERQNRVDSFQRGEFRVIICQYAVGAMGLNMESARLCSHYSYDFNLEYWDQSIGRIARTTQTRPMTYFPILMRGTIDKLTYRVLQGKANLKDAITRALMTGNVEELF